jgi:hypothetical protein
MLILADANLLKCLALVPEELDKVVSWQQRYEEHCQQAGDVLVEGFLDDGVLDVPLILPFRLPVPENIKCHYRPADEARARPGLVDVVPQVPEVQGKGENIRGCCCRDARAGMFPG